MTLDRNLTDYHTEMEQAAFEPNNLVPGIALSPDKMLLARGFSYSDAHRARLGVNYKQIPVNSPVVETHAYSKDGAMRVQNVSDPVYAPNSKGGPKADTEHYPAADWYADGDMVRSAYTLHAEDDDWGQAGTMVREVLDDAARERLVDNVVGHLLNGVSEPVLVSAPSSTGATSTRASATRSSRASAPSRARRPQGRRASQPGPLEHAGQGLTRRALARHGVRYLLRCRAPWSAPGHRDAGQAEDSAGQGEPPGHLAEDEPRHRGRPGRAPRRWSRPSSPKASGPARRPRS